jgi:hypothetical protein
LEHWSIGALEHWSTDLDYLIFVLVCQQGAAPLLSWDLSGLLLYWYLLCIFRSFEQLDAILGAHSLKKLECDILNTQFQLGIKHNKAHRTENSSVIFVDDAVFLTSQTSTDHFAMTAAIL